MGNALVGRIDKTGGIANQRLQESGFSCPVSSDKRDLFPTAYGGFEVLEYVERSALGSVRLRKVFDLEGMSSRRSPDVESDERPLNIGLRKLRRLQPFHFLLARGHLRRACARCESRDELLQLGDLFVSLRVARFDAGAHLGLGEHHVVVTAGVSDDGLIIDVRDMRADLVQKMAVVRNDDETSAIGAQVILEPVDGIEVEVVRGFVQ